MHNHILKPPGAHVFVMNDRCTDFHSAPFSVLYNETFFI